MDELDKENLPNTIPQVLVGKVMNDQHQETNDCAGYSGLHGKPFFIICMAQRCIESNVCVHS